MKLTKEIINSMPFYFSYEAIKGKINSETSIEDSTLQTYLSRDVSAGTLSDAGKGWYSRLQKEFILDTKPLKRVLGILKKAFPLLEASSWSTEQINPFTHHMLGKHILFTYVASDAVNSVHETLLAHNYNSYANPGKPEIKKSFRISKNTVIVRPSVAKQPESLNGASPIEKILVDLLFENRRLNIMPQEEAKLVLENAMATGTIKISSMISYAKRREMDIAKTIKDFRIIRFSGDA